MSTVEWLVLSVTTVEAVGVVGTLFYVARQVAMQRRDIDDQRAAVGFQTYQQISSRYTDLLWFASGTPSLNRIWDPLEATRKSELDAAQDQGLWGAWHAMTDDERRGYRYIRAALEIIEQAHETYTADLIAGSAWQKWEAWLRIWVTTAYFPYVLDDNASRFTVSFVKRLRAAIKQIPGEAGGGLGHTP